MIFKILRKNFNLILLLIIIKFFSDSLNEFIGNNTVLLSSYNNLQNIESVQNKGISDNSNKFALTKRKIKQKEEIVLEEKKENTRIASFRNPEFFSDTYIDEETLGQTLVPITEKILFSGIPIPESKPYPSKRDISRLEVLTVKSEKDLKTVLNKRLVYFLNYNEIFQIISTEINYKAKNNLKLFYTNQAYNDEILSEFSVYKNKLFEVRSIINNHDRFVSQYIATPTDRKIARYKVKVVNNIHSSLQDLKIPKVIVKEFINQFSFSVDFQRDISDGDFIELLFEADYLGDEELVGTPTLLYASLDLLKNQKVELFRYKMASGKVDYFDSQGKSIRKSIMRTPVNGARLSSRFGVRKHPILGYSKMHRGVDFAAKRGTPIMAAGDGRVSFAGRNGSYGKFVEIRHLNSFSTRYGHMHKFAKNIKKGTIVKQGQIIGYVGNTGRSTGPHLHYEVKHKRRIINPMTLKLPSKVKVEDIERSNFYANISLTRDRLSTTPVKNKNRFVVID
tara:strand:- start:55 stop:1575 length:1521 start_codon:yes stop_codon:yes gene_type:complete